MPMVIGCEGVCVCVYGGGGEGGGTMPDRRRSEDDATWTQVKFKMNVHTVTQLTNRKPQSGP